jgi:hypothetical protein
MPVPVAARFKAWVCDRSLAGISGSNPAGGMDVSSECCMLSSRGLCDGPITHPERLSEIAKPQRWRVLDYIIHTVQGTAKASK